MKYEIIKKCRVCGSEDIKTILHLGAHPLANTLKMNAGEEDVKYPLSLLFCSNCSLVQIRETVNKDLLFNKYIWVTDTSSAARQFASEFYHNILEVKSLKKSDLVVEIGSNDGTFLKPFVENDYNVIGIDPAKNIADMANEGGIRTINTFWNQKAANNIVSKYGNAKLIFARNVVPHASELHKVISGIGLCLADNGVGAVEFHYAGNILEQLQYDSIYHEHLCYFSIKTIEYLLKMHDLHPFHIHLSPISGGAYIIYFAKKISSLSDNYEKLINREKLLSVNEFPPWKSFATRCNNHREESRKLVEKFSKVKIVGFGASARSSTYLNFCGFDSAYIQAIIDNNSLKQHMYSPGASIPIVSLKKGIQMNSDLIFILAWNFRDEIVKECRMNGYKGEFLVAFPDSPYYFKG